MQLNGHIDELVRTKCFSEVSIEPLDKWKDTLLSPVRKAWCRRYLKWIGEERLDTMGYKLNVLIYELDPISSELRHIGSDLLHIVYGVFHYGLELRILKHKLDRLPGWYRNKAHE